MNGFTRLLRFNDIKLSSECRFGNYKLDDRLVTNGIDFVNIAKLIGKAFAGKTKEEQMTMKPSQILPYVFDSVFFEKDLNLEKDQVVGYLEYIDSQMKSSQLLKQTKQFELIDYLINKSKEYKEVLTQEIQ